MSHQFLGCVGGIKHMHGQGHKAGRQRTLVKAESESASQKILPASTRG